MSSSSDVKCPVASGDSTAGTVSGDVYAWDYTDFRDNVFKVDPSSLRMQWDPVDVVPEELGTICLEPVHAVSTFGDGACAVHAVFGTPTASGGLTKKGARDLVRHLLGSSIQSLLDRGAKQEHVQASQTSFWTELVYLERTASDQKRVQDEPKFFWDSLTHSSKKVAETAKQHFDSKLVSRREAVALKISVLESSRMFFRLELERQVIRQLAVRFGYIPAGMDVLLLSSEDLELFYAVNHGCYDFLIVFPCRMHKIVSLQRMHTMFSNKCILTSSPSHLSDT
jgi:hypothetical protein